MDAATRSRTGIGRARGALVQLVVGALLTLGLLAAAEYGAGVYLARRQAAQVEANLKLARDDFVAGVLAWMDINPVPLAPDPELLWRNRPGSEKTQPINPRVLDRDLTWTIHNGAGGFRGGPAVVSAEHPGVYRVLCVGDSITFGFNVDAEDTYPRQLQRLLEKRYPGRRFAVLNAGVAGWSWVQGRRFLEVEGLALHPDAVIIGHGTNDQFFPAKVTDGERIGRGPDRVRRGLRKLAARLADTNLYRLALLVGPHDDGVSPGCAAQPAGACRRVSLSEIRAAVVDVDALTRAAGADLVVVNVDFMETPAIEGVRDGVGATKVPFLDFPARFRALREEADARRAREHGLAPATVAATTAEAAVARSVVLRVLARRPELPHTVQGNAYLGGIFDFDATMYDDGTHGDEVAGDGVFTVTLTVPPGVHALEYKYAEGGAPEFTPLPPLPSTNGIRLVRIPGDVRGPVEVLGDLPLMAERTHPNADGQRLIAGALLEMLEGLPSLQRFVEQSVE